MSIRPMGPSQAGLAGAYAPPWAATTVYAAGQAVRSPTGQVVRSAFAHTSGASYDPRPWLAPDEATPTLLDTFDTDTAAGSGGTPKIGPGGAWTITGAAAATAQVSGGRAISPGGVSYWYKVLAATPDRMRMRIRISSGTNGPTIACCNNTAPLSIPALNSVHVNITTSNISLLLFTAGSSAVPTVNIGGALNLATGVDYDVDVRIVGNYVHVHVFRTSDGVLMGSYLGYDTAVPTVAGPLVYIEPSATSDISFMSVAPASQVDVPYRIAATGGVEGPIGMQSPDMGLFSIVGVGTGVPVSPVHVVQPNSNSQPGVLVKSAHSSGAGIRAEATAAGSPASFWLANTSTGSNPVRLYVAGSSTTLGIDVGGIPVVNLMANGMTLGPNNNAAGFLTIISGNSTKIAQLGLQVAGQTEADIYQPAASSSLHFKVGGSDRLKITSAGVIDLVSVATTTTAPSAGAAGALPATPAGYATVSIGGTPRQIPYY